jgi:hypothetical protein
MIAVHLFAVWYAKPTPFRIHTPLMRTLVVVEKYGRDIVIQNFNLSNKHSDIPVVVTPQVRLEMMNKIYHPLLRSRLYSID